MSETFLWDVFCVTDSRFEQSISPTEPTTCPVDAAHTIRSVRLAVTEPVRYGWTTNSDPTATITILNEQIDEKTVVFPKTDNNNLDLSWDIDGLEERQTTLLTDFLAVFDPDTLTQNKVKIKNLPLGELGVMAASQIRRTFAYNNLPTSFISIDFDTTDYEQDTTVIKHDTSTRSLVNVYDTSLYLIAISGSVQVTNTQGNDDDPNNPENTTTLYTKILKNSTAILPGSEREYSANKSNDMTVSIVVLTPLTANDTISLQFKSSLVNALNLDTQLVMQVIRLKGPKGDTGAQGATGSGSSIILKDEGTNLQNTPHTVLNFTGNAVDLTDAGSGQATISITTPIFGSDYHYAEKLTTSSTTATSWQENLTFTTSTLLAGDYRISWSFEWRLDATNQFFDAQLQVDNSNTIMSMSHEPQDSSSWILGSGFAKVTLTNATHTVDFDFKVTGSIGYIRNNRIELFRVS